MKTRQNFLIYSLLLMGVFFVFDSSFEKDDNNSGNSLTDSRDENIYQTLTIGGQVWIAENLN